MTCLKRTNELNENFNLFLVMNYQDVNSYLHHIKDIADFLNGCKVRSKVYTLSELSDSVCTMERLESWRFCIPITFSYYGNQPSVFRLNIIDSVLDSRPSVVITSKRDEDSDVMKDTVNFLKSRGAVEIPLDDYTTFGTILGSLGLPKVGASS